MRKMQLKPRPRMIAGALLFAVAPVIASANTSLAERQAKSGCESYAKTMLGLADSWRFENDGQTFDLRQRSTGDDLGIEMFQGMFDAVNHPGLKRFLNDTIEYLWEDEERARRFINSGRFMEECIPANTELMKRELQPASEAEIRQRLQNIRRGVAQGHPPVTPEQMPVPRSAAPQRTQNAITPRNSSTRADRNTGAPQRSESARQSNQQQQPKSSGLSSRR